MESKGWAQEGENQKIAKEYSLTLLVSYNRTCKKLSLGSLDTHNHCMGLIEVINRQVFWGRETQITIPSYS